MKLFSKERLVWITAVVIMFAAMIVMNSKYQKLYYNYDNAVQNNKAYVAQIDNEKSKSNMFKMTIEELLYNTDSISQKLIEAKNELKVKDKQIKQLEYIYSEYKKTDTLILTDTIFCEPDFTLDTVIGDEWVSTVIHLEYPSTIGITPSVKSEKTVAVYVEKETVEPPKKFFLCRWFQKKHMVAKVKVKEENPHIIEQENVFIEIVD